MDWKKEYRASDLFRRKKPPPSAGPPPAEAEATPPEPGPADAVEDASVWKKEVKVSDLFRRGKKQAEEPGPELAPSDLGAGPARTETETGPIPSDVSPEPVGAGPAPPEPEPAPEPLATEPSAPQPSVWKKEVKVSDLFRRGKKQAEEPGPEAVHEEPAGEPLEAQVPETELAVDAPEVAAELPAALSAEHAPEQEPAEFFAVEPPFEEPVVDEPVEEPVAEEPVWAKPQPSEAVDAEPAELVGAGLAPPEPMPPEPEPYLPEPAPPPVGAAREQSVWKKDMKVSDLFRRKKGSEGADEPEPVGAGLAPSEAASAEDAAPVPTSVWKKEIRLAPRRGRGPDKPARREKPDRRPRRERAGPDRAARSDARGSKSTAGLPDVPLVRSLNLLPRDEEKTRSARLPSLATAGVALAGLLVLGGLAFAFLQARSRIDDRAGVLEDLEAQVAAIQAPAQVAPEAGTQLAGEALARAGALTAALDGRFVWDRLLRKLSLVLPDDVWFETVQSAAIAPTVDPATGLTIPAATATITINGYAKTQAGLAQLVGRLDVLPELGLVQLQSGAVIELGGQDVVQFTVAATLERPPEA